MDGSEHSDDQQSSTLFGQSFIAQALSTIQTYGWFILIGLCVAYWVWEKYLKERFSASALAASSNEAQHKKYDESTIVRRHEEMERARQRWQQKYETDAQLHAAQEKLRQEELAEKRIQEWDDHVKGLGYKSKTHMEDGSSTAPRVLKKKKPTDLRGSDFNPLMGGSGSGYRPSPRSGGFGGGGG